jgi:hypothetical protein
MPASFPRRFPVIFKGHLPISYTKKFQGFVDDTLRLPRKAFIKTQSPAWSKKLVQHAQRQAQKQQRTYCYHQERIDKDAWPSSSCLG